MAATSVGSKPADSTRASGAREDLGAVVVAGDEHVRACERGRTRITGAARKSHGCARVRMRGSRAHGMCTDVRGDHARLHKLLRNCARRARVRALAREGLRVCAAVQLAEAS